LAYHNDPIKNRKESKTRIIDAIATDIFFKLRYLIVQNPKRSLIEIELNCVAPGFDIDDFQRLLPYLQQEGFTVKYPMQMPLINQDQNAFQNCAQNHCPSKYKIEIKLPIPSTSGTPRRIRGNSQFIQSYKALTENVFQLISTMSESEMKQFKPLTNVNLKNMASLVLSEAEKLAQKEPRGMSVKVDGESLSFFAYSVHLLIPVFSKAGIQMNKIGDRVVTPPPPNATGTVFASYITSSYPVFEISLIQ
jgi:hypothetical protein